MMLSERKSFWKWYLGLAIVFALMVSINFTKPFGFFRESNPALVAITATYWQQNPDTRTQHIPLFSYAFRKDLPPATQFDNTITTFGYGWFAAPYYFLQVTGIPAGPVGLRIFSVLWLLFTVFAIYRLAMRLSVQLNYPRSITFITVLFYVLSPVVAWYQVNGYVHETAVLPFYYLGWYFFLRLLQERKSKWAWLAAACVFIGIQFDWLPVFQGVVMSAYLLFSRKERLPRWTFLIPGLFALLGTSYIVYHYTSWSSVKDYFHFMQWKFGTRTVGREGPSYLSGWPSNLNIILFYILSYGILLLWLFTGLVRKKIPFLPLLMMLTGLLHHVVFWGFSSEHDYATLKMAFPICYIAAVFVCGMQKKMALLSAVMIVAMSIAQYYFLHNYTYRKGMYEDDYFFEKAGAAVRSKPPDTIIFLNTGAKYFPQVEFYAGRAYKMAVSAEDARRQLDGTDSLAKGYYIEVTTDPFKKSTGSLWSVQDLDSVK